MPTINPGYHLSLTFDALADARLKLQAALTGLNQAGSIGAQAAVDGATPNVQRALDDVAQAAAAMQTLQTQLEQIRQQLVAAQQAAAVGGTAPAPSNGNTARDPEGALYIKAPVVAALAGVAFLAGGGAGFGIAKLVSKKKRGASELAAEETPQLGAGEEEEEEEEEET